MDDFFDSLVSGAKDLAGGIKDFAGGAIDLTKSLGTAYFALRAEDMKIDQARAAMDLAKTNAENQSAVQKAIAQYQLAAAQRQLSTLTPGAANFDQSLLNVQSLIGRSSGLDGMLPLILIGAVVFMALKK